jgi:hypothetical protein
MFAGLASMRATGQGSLTWRRSLAKIGERQVARKGIMCLRVRLPDRKYVAALNTVDLAAKSNRSMNLLWPPATLAIEPCKLKIMEMA